MIDGVVLRNDLVVTEKREGEDHFYLVENPDDNATYELGEQEWFLLQSIADAISTADIIERFTAKYNISMTQDDLASFISMLMEWGLVRSENDVEKLKMTESSSNGGFNATGSEFDDFIEMPPVTSIIAADRQPRQRSRQSAQEQEESSKLNWLLFNPDSLCHKLSDLLSPLSWLRYLIPVLVVIAIAIIFNNLRAFMFDFLRIRSPLSIIQILIFSMFTVNLVTQLWKGVAARKHGVEATGFGVKLVFGFLPRFAITTGELDHLSRSHKLDVFTSPLMIRLIIFSLATFLWLMSRSSATMLPSLNLMLLVVAAVSFILAANPLLKSDGYDTLTTILETPNLRQKANLALFSEKDSLLAEHVLEDDNAFALRAYALSSLIFMFVLLGGAMILSARWFELNYQGTGVAVYLTLTTYLIWRFYSRFVTKRAEMKDRRAKIEAALAAREKSGRVDAGGQRSERKKKSGEPSGWKMTTPRWILRLFPGPLKKLVPTYISKRHIFLIIFFIVLLLPYPYETGGVLKVLPDRQHEIYAETPGVLKQVYYKSGEFLKQDTVVARLSSLEQEKNLLITQASILEQQAKLEQLQNTPTEEEVVLAKSRLATASTQYKYSSESAKRLETLHKDGNVSFDTYQDEQKQMEVDRKQMDEARANLNKVLAGPHPKEIEAAIFELDRLKEKLKFDQEEIKRTNLVMPMDGHIVTPNLDHLVGLYLDEGDHFATVENDDQVRVEIQVPESDIADVVPGADARFKVWAYGDQLFHGKVSEIAHVASEQEYGKVIAVTLIIPNEDHLLKSGMTGFGKVDSGTKIVAVAFTRMLVRFFTIEMWSWIP